MPSGSIEIENKKKEIKFKGYVTAPASGVYPGVLLLHQKIIQYLFLIYFGETYQAVN